MLGIFRGGGNLSHNHVQVALYLHKQAAYLRCPAEGTSEPQCGRCFVQITKCFKAGMVFGKAVFTKQTSFTIITSVFSKWRHAGIITRLLKKTLNLYIKRAIYK